jgi:RNA polymerase sigma factor (sigma-70 family)
MNDADSILVSFLRSTEKSERDSLLGELIAKHAAPIIWRTIRRRFGPSINQSGAGSVLPDRDDLYQEIVKNLLQRLTYLQSQRSQARISNFRQYVARVAENTCHNYLREKTPARYHLKDTLRNLLERRREFKTWRNDQNAILCGLAGWSEGEIDLSHVTAMEELIANFDVKNLKRKSRQSPLLVDLVMQVFKHAKRPIELDDLVEIVAHFLGVVDHPQMSLDQNHYIADLLPDSTTGAETRLEMRETLRQLWREVLRMPKHYLHTILLGYSNKNRVDLLSLFLETDSLTFAEFAAALEMTEDELSDLWFHLPLGTAEIADRFDTTSDQVSKWRYFAHQELKSRIRK